MASGRWSARLAVQVRDFLPDRLKMSARFTTESANGWVSPQGLQVKVDLQNLFGAPAQKRRIEGTVDLLARLPAIHGLPGFHVPQSEREPRSAPASRCRPPPMTEGKATVDLNLARFDRALYQVYFSAEGFEADGGRAVSAAASQLVSGLPYLIGWKADGGLDYVHRDSKRAVELIAIGPDARKLEVRDIKVSRYELRSVSTLIRQNNGVYKYESRVRSVLIDSSDIVITDQGFKLALETGTPGRFAYEISDGAGQPIARVEYFVAGDANLTRTLDKNAQLQITLARNDYAPGDEVEMQIQAPYVGAGLITIERDRVYAWRWFKTSTTSSTQRITRACGTRRQCLCERGIRARSVVR